MFESNRFFQSFYLSTNNYNKYFHRFMGKNKVQEIMASCVPDLIGFGFSVVVITCLLRKLGATMVACTSENF
jgi:hypothetical protein